MSASVPGTEALAQDAPPSGPAVPRFELWSGAEVFHRVWSLYGGGQYAPFGSIREDGFRVRVTAGTQQHQVHGTTSFSDLLAGYHKQLGPVTIKVLGGLTVANQSVDDPQASSGTEMGGKAVLETWWNITDRAWTSVDASWTTLHDVYGSRARLGWRLWPELSIGLEGGATGTWDYDSARAGAFVRYEWASGEVSLSGGVSGDGPRSGWVDVQGPFGTVSLLTRF
jgi:Cellulose biosynthesis protein BcsS